MVTETDEFMESTLAKNGQLRYDLDEGICKDFLVKHRRLVQFHPESDGPQEELRMLLPKFST